ncbi:lytic transglycosylase domain-containing protein [Rhodosalinus sp.]|uniref:lytic transglycosylase domain-containing protein n=1 Tax=Rhodosalinus sp. TaxID=2047741 RepID=UPI0035676C08
MRHPSRRAILGLVLLPLAACGGGRDSAQVGTMSAATRAPLNPGETPEMRRLVNKWADRHDIPPALVHRVIQRESDYRADALNPAGPYYGLMQILPATARSMGHRGPARALLDPEVNLKYAGRYLRGAWLVSGGDIDDAVMWYARGYYYEAKRLGLLEETGLR